MDKSGLFEYVHEQTKVFVDAAGKESDRTLGIIVGCWLDNLLEKKSKPHI